MLANSPRRRVAYLLADTPIPDDPRVRRVGDLLHDAGWDVTGIGLGGWRSSLPAWRILSPALQAYPSEPPLLLPAGDMCREALKRAWQSAAWLGALAFAPATPILGAFSQATAAAFERERLALRNDPTWPIRHARRLRAGVTRLGVWVQRAPKWARLYAGHHDNVEDDFLYRSAPHLHEIRRLALTQSQPGIWIANDWRMLPIAAEAVQKIGDRLVYDSHEFATEEYAQKLSWRILQRPIAAAVEKRWIGTAAAVLSVSPGITDALRRTYALKAPTDTIRNTPSYQDIPFRATGDRVELLYHGVVSPGRGLEAAIAAIAQARPEYHLSIRGPSGDPAYRAHLEALIHAAGLQSRVRLLDPVSMPELVTAAAAFDVGLCTPPGHSQHNLLALPNKFFEYMMAGLALCVSDHPAMADVIRSTGAGVLVPGLSPTPTAIAASLNALDRDRIDAMKKASLAAARSFNWQSEGARLLTLMDQLASEAV